MLCCRITCAIVLPMMLAISACRYPESQVRTVDDRPRLAVENAPEGSVLFLDGNRVGPAKVYSPDEGPLWLEPGTHRVTVRSETGQVLLNETIFLGASELKVLKIY